MFFYSDEKEPQPIQPRVREPHPSKPSFTIPNYGRRAQKTTKGATGWHPATTFWVANKVFGATNPGQCLPQLGSLPLRYKNTGWLNNS
jgi:hypothetical protein